MAIVLPATLTAGSPENVNDVQSNFAALVNSINAVAGDVSGSVDDTTVEALSEVSTPFGTAGLLKSGPNYVSVYSNYNGADDRLIDTTKPGWQITLQDTTNDQLVIKRALATAGAPTFTTIFSISSSGAITGGTATPTDDSVTSAKIVDGAIVNADVNAAAAIAESKLTLASDAAAGTASRRSLGTTATTAAAGNHGHSDLAPKATPDLTGVVTTIGGWFQSDQTNLTDLAFAAKRSADSLARFGIRTDGDLEWGGGAGARDTFLSRSGVGELLLEGSLTADILATGSLVALTGALLQGGVSLAGGADITGGGTWSGNPEINAPTLTNTTLLSGHLRHTGASLSFYNHAAQTKQTILGSRDSNGALNNLLEALENLGLITDNTTAT